MTHFLLYREVDKGGRVVRKYLCRHWGVGNRYSWRQHRLGAARFHSLEAAEREARVRLGAKVERRE